MSSSSSRCVLALALLAIPAAAQSVKLNAPLAREVAGWIGFPRTSPDGQTLVYLADRDGGPEAEIHALAAGGKGGPRRLSGAIEGGDLQITLDGAGVLFLDDLDASGSVELALVPIDGSAPPSALSGPMVAGGNVQSFQASRDGLHCVYLADQVADEVLELFSVPITGSAPPVKLSGVLVSGGDVLGLTLSSDGRLALYSADQDVDGVYELFVAPIDGSAPARKLPIPLVPGGDVVYFLLDPGASHVLYTADQEEDERFELFTIQTDGSQPPLKLNGPLVPGGDVSVSYGNFLYAYFDLSLDGRWVVYSADQDTDQRFELYTVPADGSLSAVKLSSPSDHEPVLAGLSYDSTWVVYRSDPGMGTYELFSAPIDGSAPSRRISGAMTPGGDAYFPAISFDSRRVVYAADQDVDSVYELYSAPIDGSAPPVKLNAPLPPGGDIAVEPAVLLPGFFIMEDGVMYEADQEVDNLKEIYFAPVAGGAAPRKLVSGPVNHGIPAYDAAPPGDFARVYFYREQNLRTLFSVGVEPGAQPILLDEAMSSVAVGDVGDFLLSASGERAVYRAQEEGQEWPGELVSVRTSKPSVRAPLLSGLPPGQFPVALFFTPDERRVIHMGLSSTGGQTALYSGPVDGSGPPVRLDVLPAGDYRGGGVGGEFGTIAPLPDGQRLVFLAGVAGTTRTGLFLAPADGSAPPLLLSGDLDLLAGLELSADGSRIAFRSNEASVKLYVVPSDGSALPRRVDLGQRPQHDFELSPDGEQVFFRTSPNLAPDELFVAPSDASAAPRRLNAPLQGRGDVTGFALDPLGLRVVYRADQELDEQFELYSVPADSSAAAVRLHAPLSGALDVRDFRISADATYVVLSGDLRTDEVHELFSAPLDASRAPVTLSGNPASGPGVLDYRLSPDGQRVVYRAYRAVQAGYGPLELFSSSIRGSRGPVKLSRPLIPDGGVWSFQISGDSRTVAFTTERLPTPPYRPEEGPRPRLTLLAVPIRGQEKASEIAGPFHGEGSVSAFQLSADGSVVVYLADQDEPFAIELYAARRPSSPGTTPAAKR